MRSVGEASRRGIDNVLANWPLILIRIAEQVLILLVVLAVVFGALAPIVLGAMTLSLPELFEVPGALEELFATVSPLLAIYAIGIVSLALLAGIVVHSFVQAGVIGCYLQGERTAREGAARGEFRAFSPELWWAEARRSGWQFFWIYNIIWGAYSVLIFLPFIPIILMLLLFPESPAALIVTCGSLVLVVLAAVILAFGVFLWSQVVLIERVATGAGVLDSISRSRVSLRGRMGPVILIGIVFFAVSTAVGSVVAGFSIGADLASAVPGLDLAFLPIRIALSFLNTAVAALIGSWLLAALVAVLVAPARTPHVVRPV